MKRRGFLGSLVTIVAGSALPVKTEPEVLYEVIPKVSVDREKLVRIQPEQPKFMASGWIDETRAEGYWKSRSETVGEFWKRELDKER
jgi:hypothetical protein